VTAFVAVRYGASDYVGDEPVCARWKKHPGVLECHHIAGDDCYILKVSRTISKRAGDSARSTRPNSQMNTRTTISCPRCSKSLASSDGARLMAALKAKRFVAYLGRLVLWARRISRSRSAVTDLPPFLFYGPALPCRRRDSVGAGAPSSVIRCRAGAIGRRSPLSLAPARRRGVPVFGRSSTSARYRQHLHRDAGDVDRVIRRLIPGGQRELNWRIVTGLLLGFIGTLLLVGASPAEILAADKRGPIALTVAAVSWALARCTRPVIRTRRVRQSRRYRAHSLPRRPLAQELPTSPRYAATII